ncbi:SpoIIE family protein phosphatase [Candidatus Methylospira mobilis]|uniref:SpoIIE family protein phosphatase n=1 Tax=Candidatus Methylospira mobilis TaxID=1808979 RepID=A0A5Q0BM34_9GAMM|nr:PP2C family protein-serine/threonine phosphatase [Candidatus Methylospira mobilis]QFY44202.1 SpoIIE family protein phosphatase [Candidatus Methylospira mobilis]WNV06369.1 SpoIIE family protein phosphatase [Candidatus Methylospira mobilis]
MKLKTRLLLIVSALLALSIVATAVSLAYNTQRAILDQAEDDGKTLAGIIARTADMGETVETEAESLLSQDMVTSARIVSHFVAVAEKAGLSPKEINRHLDAMVGSDDLGEIGVTDPKGKVYLHSEPSGGFQFRPEASKQPQASEFWSLLNSRSGVVVQDVLRRDMDGKIYKYVGVSGIDKPRIVQVGLDGKVIDTMKRTLGTQEYINRIVKDSGVERVWVVNQDLAVLHFAGAGKKSAELSVIDKANLNSAMRNNQIISDIEGDRITVAAPIHKETGDPDAAQGSLVGATLLHIPTETLHEALVRELIMTAVIVLVVMFCAVLMLTHYTNSITAPLLVVTDAAHALQDGNLNMALLDPVARRMDALGVLARVFQEMARKVQGQKQELEETVVQRTVELEEKNRLLEFAQQTIENELDVAHSLQQAILPAHFPNIPGYTASAIMLPAKQLAGDFYDYIELGNGRVGILIADVADKGVASSFFMAICRTAIRTVAETLESPAQVLSEANRRIYASNPKSLFVTVFYGVLDARSGWFTYANGGHLPPYLFGATKQPEKLPRTAGMALGVVDDAEFGEHRVHIAPGDRVFLYSDGITEAFNEQGRGFGDAALATALIAVADRSPGAIIQYLVDTVKNFEGNAPQSDDLTSIALARSFFAGSF